jgi:hypothetical protein
MDKTSTFYYLIKTLSPENCSDVFALESLYDFQDNESDLFYEYLNSLKTDVREEVVQKLVKFAKEYREKISERENVKMNPQF